MLKVTEVAKQLGVNNQTLYFYERIGLIPSPQRNSSGYRLFSDRDVERLRFIIHLKRLGLSLPEIREILALQEDDRLSCDRVYQHLKLKEQEIDYKIQELQALKSQLLPLIETCDARRSSAQTEPCSVLNTVQTPVQPNPSKSMTPLKIEVLGTGCKKCQQLEANATEAVNALAVDAEINHITDMMEITKRGVMKTPALVIGDRVMTQGKVPSSEEIQTLING
jgi:small redox-active disulfide protein 2